MELEITLDAMPITIGDNLVIRVVDGALEIVELSADSPLAELGLQAGDRITAINGEPLEPGSLRDIFRNFNPDEGVTLTVQRGDETLEIEVTGKDLMGLFVQHMMVGPNLPNMPGLREFPNLPGHPNMPGLRELRGQLATPTRLGVTFLTLDEETAAANGIDVTEGALITQVMPGTPAADAGLHFGDIITSVNGDVVDAERTLADRITAYESGDTVTLSVLRGGETLEIEVTLE